jgi:hypothetical protein
MFAPGSDIKPSNQLTAPYLPIEPSYLKVILPLLAKFSFDALRARITERSPAKFEPSCYSN